MKPNSPDQFSRDSNRLCRIPIRTYLILMNILMFCLLLPVLSLFFWNKASQFKNDELVNSIETIRSSLKTRGSSLLGNLALSTNQAIASFDFSTLNLMVRQVTSNDTDIQYCMVTNREGVTVAHNREEMVGATTDDDFSQRVQLMMERSFPPTSNTQNSMPVNFLYESDNPNSGIMEAITPVYSGTNLWGALRCGYSLQSLQQQIQTTESRWLQEKNRFTWVFVLIVGLFLLLGLSVSMYFTHYFSHAIGILNKSVNEVANGNLETQIPAKHMLCMEFNSLANAINHMANNLFSSRQQLDEYSNSLERLVAERTQKLEVSNKELESFSYSVSHDLRAPLRSINGFSKILQEDSYNKLDDEGKDCIRRVRANAQHMEELIEGLLTLSRLSRQPLKQEDFDLGEYARELLEQHHKYEPGRALKVVVEDGLIVHSDPSMVKIIMDNLIGNAWKYSAKKELTIIEVGQYDNNGQTTYFVKDNGAGFDMREADKLFGAFQRLHKATDFSGSGIGLATVQRIINRLGGRIWARAEIDKGASFFFTIPSLGQNSDIFN